MTQASADIAGLQQAQADLLRIEAGLLAPTGLAAVVGEVTLALHRYAVANTHVGRYVQTRTGRYRWAPPGTPGAVGGGALRASQSIEMPRDAANPVGRVYLASGAVNPYTQGRPSIYGVYEHERGGEHAFYAQAIRDGNTSGVITGQVQAMVNTVVNGQQRP